MLTTEAPRVVAVTGELVLSVVFPGRVAVVEVTTPLVQLTRAVATTRTLAIEATTAPRVKLELKLYLTTRFTRRPGTTTSLTIDAPSRYLAMTGRPLAAARTSA